jgi:hypothetical protein
MPFAAPFAVLCVFFPAVEAAFLGREAAVLADVRFTGADATEAAGILMCGVRFESGVCACMLLVLYMDEAARVHMLGLRRAYCSRMQNARLTCKRVSKNGNSMCGNSVA